MHTSWITFLCYWKQIHSESAPVGTASNDPGPLIEKAYDNSKNRYGLAQILNSSTRELHLYVPDSATAAGANIYFSTCSAANAYTRLMSVDQSGNVRATGTFLGSTTVTSDARTKTLTAPVDSDNIGRRIQQLPVRSFEYIDTPGKGTVGFIGQEMAPLFPDLVTTDGKEFIPDIRQHAQAVYTDKEGLHFLLTNPPTALVVGERLRLILDLNSVSYETERTIRHLVETEEGTGVTVEGTENPSGVFVYGREVSDFHRVNYAQITPYLVAALQELQRKLDNALQEIEQLKSRV